MPNVSGHYSPTDRSMWWPSPHADRVSNLSTTTTPEYVDEVFPPRGTTYYFIKDGPMQPVLGDSLRLIRHIAPVQWLNLTRMV